MKKYGIQDEGDLMILSPEDYPDLEDYAILSISFGAF